MSKLVLGRLVCFLFRRHVPSDTARQDDSRKLWVIGCVRCGAELEFTIPCPEYPDESMGNCGDVQCHRRRGEPDVCEYVFECREAWLAATDRWRISRRKQPRVSLTSIN